MTEHLPCPEIRASILGGMRRSPVTAAQALLPLRVFLGVTFVYAGVQKLSDPGFLRPGAATYIGTQLRGFAQGTPGGVLLRTFALPHPALAGVGVAVIEIAVGLLVLVGLATRLAALAGLGLNLVLFLTASWRTSPYFLGSDIVFVFAWLPFVLAGSSGQPALEHALARAPTRRTTSGMTRRQALAAAWAGLGAVSVGIAGLAAALKGQPARTPTLATTVPTPTHSRRRRQQQQQVPHGAVRLGSSSQLPAGSGALYPDPADGSADIVVRQPSGGLTACSAICPHAGCRVEYTGGALVCPCHGSIFDSRTGAVRRGPAIQPLARKRVVERQGSIYALPS